MKSFRESPYAGLIPNHIYRTVYETCIDDLLSRGAKIDVLCSAADPDYIVGYVCHEHNPEKFKGKHVLHYVFIREKFRMVGLAKMLLAELGEALYTFRVPGGFDKKIQSWGYKHAPYIARIKYRETK